MTWKKGQSGNPAGRPPGLGDVGRLLAELYSRLPEVLEAAIRAAVGGDVAAMRLVLERTIPALRPEELPVSLRGFTGSRVELVAAVVDAIAEGRLDTSRGGRLIAALTPSELDERITAVERRYVSTDERQKRLGVCESVMASALTTQEARRRRAEILRRSRRGRILL